MLELANEVVKEKMEAMVNIIIHRNMKNKIILMARMDLIIVI